MRDADPRVPFTRLQRLDLCNFKPVCDDSWVQSFGDVSVGLLQELAYQEHNRRCSVAANVVLGGRGSSNHDGCGVLYLHLS